jgi:subtilisin-like proprotein convertase family protein
MTRRLLLVGLALLVIAGALPAGMDSHAQEAAGSCINDPFEPNDTQATGSRVSIPFEESLWACIGDDDWFVFPATEGGGIQVLANFTDAEGDIDIFVHDPAGTQVAASFTTTDDEDIQYVPATSGLFAVRARLFDDPDGNGNNYGLHIETSCPGSTGTGPSFFRGLSAPLDIPDNSAAGISHCFIVPDTRTINDMDVALTVAHSWVGDLKITLTHENTGTSVILMDRPGVPGTPAGCSGDNIAATFSDEGAAPVETKCNPAIPTINGTVQPEEPLSAFDGEPMAGTWTLSISDNGVSDVGALSAWSLRPALKEPTTPTPTSSFTPTSTQTTVVTPTLTIAPPATPTPTTTPGGLVGDANCDGSVNAIDAALVLQYAAGLIGALPCAANADANTDGGVNAIDAALILQYSAGLIGTLPP